MQSLNNKFITRIAARQAMADAPCLHTDVTEVMYKPLMNLGLIKEEIKEGVYRWLQIRR